jgi:hypothetical protein
MRRAQIILILISQCFFLTDTSFAHPASGIVVWFTAVENLEIQIQPLPKNLNSCTLCATVI